ncbi:MAG: YfiH family protein [Parasphingorhabdus sp.]|jgi:YfiH family protein
MIAPVPTASYLPVFTSRLIDSQAGIKHGFFSRNGGVSTGIYASLNCSTYSADDESSVFENRSRIKQHMGVTQLVGLRQVHGNWVVDAESLDNGASVEADGLVSTSPGTGIAILTADCVPVLFCDAINRVVGAAHAGWKGACDGVVSAVVEQMLIRGAERKNIVAAIGPAIQEPSYEVKDDFVESVGSISPQAIEYFLVKRDKKLFFDLPALVKDQCFLAGISLIDNLGFDTYTDPDGFFSYRYGCQQGFADYGRQLSVISISNL